MSVSSETMDMDALHAIIAPIVAPYLGSTMFTTALLVCLISSGFIVVRPMVSFASWIILHMSPFLQGKKLPPGSFGFLWLSETLLFFSSLHAGRPMQFILERTVKQASDTFRTNIFFHPTIVVQGAAANRFLSTSENKQDMMNSKTTALLEILGRNIPTAVHGAQHKRQRQIMSKCLGPAGLEKVLGKAERLTEEHFQTIWKEGAQLSVVDSLKMHVFRIACSLLAGMEDEGWLKEMQKVFQSWIAGLALHVPLDLPGTPYNKAKRARDTLRREIDRLIQQRQRELQDKQPFGGSDRQDNLFSQFILARDDDGRALPMEELRDVILFLLFAAHDTSATALTFTLKYLEDNPMCRRRLLQEHEAIASQRKAREPLKWVDITSMKYTWAVIQETLRLRPPVMFGLKKSQRDLNYDGYIIPKGWKVLFAMLSTHENGEYFKDPSNFDPSRFEVERMENESRPPFAYVPFGLGPHACKGVDFARMSISLYIHYLMVGRFRWTSLEPHETCRYLPFATLSKGYPITISCDKSPSLANGSGL